MDTLINILFPVCAAAAFVLTIVAMGYAPNGDPGGSNHIIIAGVCAVVAMFWEGFPNLLTQMEVGFLGIGLAITGAGFLVFAWARLAHKTSEWGGVFVGLPAMYLLIAGINAFVYPAVAAAVAN